MKKIPKQLFLFALLLFTLAMMPAVRSRADDGNSGDLNWEMGRDGIMTITDSGDARSIQTGYPAWHDFADEILEVIVDVGEVTLVDNMFADCINLEKITFKNIDTSKATSFSGMFSNCRSLKTIDLSAFDTGACQYYDGMFASCTSLKSLDLTSFDTSEGLYFDEMFAGCTSLELLDISSFSFFGKISMVGMFRDCTNLRTMIRMNCSVSEFDDCFMNAATGKKACIAICYEMQCSRNFAEDLLETGSAGSNIVLFDDAVQCGTTDTLLWRIDAEGCLWIFGSGLVGDSYNNTSNIRPPWFDYADLVKTAVIDCGKVYDLECMFANCKSMTSIEVLRIDTSENVSCYSMFGECYALKEIPTRLLDTGKVTTMREMFADCRAVTSLDVSGFDTSKVTDFGCMFFGCKALENLKLGKFDTSKATKMGLMFACCDNITELDVSMFNTSKVLDFTSMFEGMRSLADLNISSFTFTSANNVKAMFKNSPYLRTKLYMDAEVSFYDTIFLQTATQQGSEVIIYYGDDCSRDYALKLKETKSPDGRIYLMDEEIPDDIMPGQPKLRDITNTSKGVSLRWYEVDGAAKYLVYKQVGNAETMLCYEITGTEFLDTKVSSGTTYNYYISAVGPTGLEGDHNFEAYSIIYLKSIESSDLYLANTGDGIKVSWPKVTGATGYNVYRKVSGGTYSRIATITSGTTLSYPDTTAVSGTSYEYAVRASYGSTMGGYSGKTIFCLSAIKSAQVSLSNADKGVKVAWPKVTGATGYNVYRRTENGTYSRIATITKGDTLTHTDETAVSGTTYYYCVRATKGTDMGSYAGKAIYFLSSVTSDKLTLSTTMDGVKVSWTKVTGAEGYYVYRKSGTGSYSRIATITDGATTSYPDTAAVGGKENTYCVRAYKGSYLSSYQAKSIYYLKAITSGQITLTNVLTGVKVTWPKVTGAAGYYVYRRLESGTYKKIATITSVSTLNYTDTDAVSGTKYFYCVRAYSGSTMGNYSGKSILYLSAIFAEGVKLNNGREGVEISWFKIDGAKNYAVYRKTASTTYSRIADLTADSLSYVDKTAASGTTYYYAIRAYNGSFYGSYESKSIYYLKAINFSDMTLANVSTGIKITWTKVTGAEGYIVYRKVGTGTYTRVVTLGASSLYHVDTAVAANNGTSYYYVVKPYKGTTYGAYSGRSIIRLQNVSISSVSNVSAQKIRVQWTQNKSGDGYQIQYSTSSTFASGNVSSYAEGSGTFSREFSGLTKGKTYYVRVRAYKTINGTKYYSGWSSIKSVAITK